MLQMRWNSNCMPLISCNGVFNLINKISIALFTLTFALGGAAVGAIAGAIKGHMTEPGLSQGVVAGGVAGAVTGIQLADLVINGERFHKVAGAIAGSIINGKVYMDWVSPALLRAYQWRWQISGTDMEGESWSWKGLSQDSIKSLAVHRFKATTSSCTICLHEMKKGEEGRWLERCNHTFHLHCIDEWLSRQPTCPICRQLVTVSSPPIQQHTFY